MSSDSYIFAFDKRNKPLLQVKSGDMVKIQTMDCFANQIKTADDRLAAIDWDRVNPATGPIYVEEAKPGDVLEVTIEKIEIGDQAVMVAGENLGVFGDELTGMSEKIMPIRDGKVFFNDEIALPIDKMVGVIGVAPHGEPVNCGTPGSHGGNMDNTMIRENSKIYFPVFTEGALFALGDVHAVMGNGEIGVSGAEISADVTVTLRLMKDRSLANPYLEDASFISTIASDESIEKAVSVAVHDMQTLLCELLPLSLADMAMLFSAAGSVEICQVVDPQKTVRFTFPKWILEKYL